MSERIRWTDDERNKMSEAVIKLWLKNPTGSVVDMVRRYMPQMPEDRRREVKGLANVPHVVAAIENYVTNMAQLKSENQSLRDRLENQKSASNTVTMDQFVESGLAEVMLDEIPLDELAAIYTRRVLAMIDSVQQYARLQPTPQTQSRPHFPPQPQLQPRARLPRVGISNLLNHQLGVLNKKFKDRVEIEVLSTNRIPSGLDCYILWASFSNHSLQYQFNDTLGKDGYVTVHGGLTSLSEYLESWLKTRV